MRTLPAFADFHFGDSSAEAEFSDSPQLLLAGFLDAHDSVERILDSRDFLVLGAKGSGKSAVGLHLKLVAGANPLLFVTTRFLKDFTLDRLNQLTEGTPGARRLPKVWSWILLLDLLSSTLRDESVAPEDRRAWERTRTALAESSLLPVRDLESATKQSAITSLALALCGFEVSATRSNERRDVPVVALATHLESLLSAAHCEGRHILIIDGLDDLPLDDGHLRALGDLISEAARLNDCFRAVAAPFKVVVLCRTDVYARIPGPNQNKLQQDYSIELDWYREATDVIRSKLVRIANIRARITHPSIKNIFESHFPNDHGLRHIVKYLLDNTRHTPRDFLRLLTYLQDSATAPLVTWQTLDAGLRRYSERYFVQEVKDELDAFHSRRDVDALLDGLRRFKRSEFNVASFHSFMARSSHLSGERLDVLLAALFDAGAVGNLLISRRGRTFQWKYRSPTASFNAAEHVIVHNALRRALWLEQPPRAHRRRSA